MTRPNYILMSAILPFSMLLLCACGSSENEARANDKQSNGAMRVQSQDDSAPPEEKAPATDEDDETEAPVDPPAEPENENQPRRGLLHHAAQPLPPPPSPVVVDESDPSATRAQSDDPIAELHESKAVQAEVSSWTVSLSAMRPYLQSAAYPNPLDTGAARQVFVTTMEMLQAAIASNTIINVSGVLSASPEDFVGIAHVHNLVIRFEAGAEIQYRGPQVWAGVLQIAPSAKQIRIENPRITGPIGTEQTCMGIEIVYDESREVCEDITITGGVFRGLNYAIQAHGGCRRMLVQDCTARDLIDYFFFGSKNIEDLTITGCNAHGVKGNHVIRLFDCNRVNIFRNDLKVDSIQDGQMKRTIWILNGERVSIAGNKTHDGRITVGPNPVADASGPDDRIGFVNIVFNRINHTHTNTPIELLSGAHDIFMKGNVITSFNDNWLGIGGWNAHRRPITNVHWSDGMVLNATSLQDWDGVALNEHYKGQPDIGPEAKR